MPTQIAVADAFKAICAAGFFFKNLIKDIFFFVGAEAAAALDAALEAALEETLPLDLRLVLGPAALEITVAVTTWFDNKTTRKTTFEP